MMKLCLLFSITYAAVVTTALVTPIRGLKRYGERKHASLSARRGSDIESDSLLSILSEDETDISSKQKKILLRNEVSSLESQFVSTEEHGDPKRFNPLIGLYEVASVITNNDKENPVGGKWTRSGGFAQKLLKTRKTYQHILPYNSTGLARYDGETSVAEAINVVSLDGLGGLLRATVILRGDVVPLTLQELKDMNTNRTINILSNLAVRANFDSPRIFFGRREPTGQEAFKYLPLQLGPLSDVVLDTSFIDQFVRIGMGGTSGTRFIFTRTNDSDNEALEYKALLQQPPAKKPKLLGMMTSILLASFYVAFGNGIKLAAAVSPSFITKSSVFSPLVTLLSAVKMSVTGLIRIFAGASGLVAGLGALLIAFSSGGIEREGMQAEAAR
eukprot:scaffold4987_cov135-Skeletonema_menzelii.AAC.3